MSQSSNDWRDGYIAGYQSVKSGQTPAIPATPTLPNGKSYYDAGYEAGEARARG